MIREYLNATLQNKNSVMFITSVMFMAGILSYFNDCEILVSAILTLIGIILVLQNRISIKYVSIWLVVFYLGFFNSYLRINTSDTLYSIAPSEVTLAGQIVSIPNNTGNDKSSFFFKVNSANNSPIEAKTYVTVNNSDNTDLDDFGIGDNYIIKGKLRRPIKAGNPSQFDYGKYLKNYNAFTTIYVDKKDCTKQILDLSANWKFLRHLNGVRNGIIESHAKYLHSPNLEILGGIVFGDDAVSPPDYIKTTFLNSGLLHILAASGMNVAFIFAFWFSIMKLLKIPYKINIIGGMAMVILYTLMTGLGPSVLRAGLMLLFIQTGKLIDRDAHSVSLLSLVAFLLLVYNPAYINDVGFQLSFLVTFGLLTMAKVIFDKMQNIKIHEWIKAGILIPIIAQIWVAPIQMFYFNTFSTYSILANIATVPFLSIISFGGFVSSILATIQPIADFTCRVFDFPLKYMLDLIVLVSSYFSELPHSIIYTTHPSVCQIFIYYILLLLITAIIELGFNKKLIISIILTALILITTTLSIPNNKLEIITFDVQNADAFLIKTPTNKYFIIDTAKMGYKSHSSTAKMVIIKYLKDKGIKNIEGIILTHFDVDHAGGTIDLIHNLHIKKIYVNSTQHDSETVDNIFKAASEFKVETQLAKNNAVIYTENNLKMRTYLADIRNSDNENSIVTLLSYNDFDMIFMGDAGTEAFNKLRKQLPTNIEVLKVGHHGAHNVVSRNMLRHLNNKISIISTGANTYGHPSKSTLDVLRETKIYRTDKHNSIQITTDGKSYKILTFNRLERKYKQTDEMNATN